MAKDKKKKGTAAGEDPVSTRDAAPELYTTVECEGVAEFEEKKSVFIGHCARVTNEEDAAAYVKQLKKQYADARHNVWAYLLRGGIVARYSDDGEPQGTAGVPVLDVIRKSGAEDVCVVVTRYFGGVLLGAGGLLRAYTRSAKDALDAAGISVVRRWVEADVPCSYSQAEKLKMELQSCGALIGDVEYGAAVTIKILMPEEEAEDIKARIFDVSAGSVTLNVTGESFRAVPVR